MLTTQQKDDLLKMLFMKAGINIELIPLFRSMRELTDEEAIAKINEWKAQKKAKLDDRISKLQAEKELIDAEIKDSNKLTEPIDLPC